MVNDIVAHYVATIKLLWSKLLAKHGYNKLEEDLTDDGRWHDNIKPLGRVAFWKKKGLDGIVIAEIKFYSSTSTAHGTGVYTIGDAYKYFKKLGYKDIFERKEKIKVNNKIYDSIEFKGSMSFREFLEEKLKSKN